MHAVLLLVAYSLANSAGAPFDPESSFDRVWSTVESHFYDAKFNGVDWTGCKSKYRPLAADCETLDQLTDVVNRMLSELNTSHTKYYSQQDAAYYFLASLFQKIYPQELTEALFPDGAIQYEGIGLSTQCIDGHHFISGVFDGGPAHDAGLRRGQRIKAADGTPFHPLLSFRGTAGKSVELTIQEAAAETDTKRIVVRPVFINPQRLMMTALENSMRVTETGGAKVAYAHLWSYAGERFHDRLKQEILSGTFRDADALILDLRDGWGGASPEYVSLFSAHVPHLTYYDRIESEVPLTAQWRKPVALLVNGGTRSGKELIAYAFRRHKLGPVVGTQTAGAVVAGRFFLFEDGTGLYLAVRGIEVDGSILEGVGVTPDHEVPWEFPYGPVRDPQFEKAIQVLTQPSGTAPGSIPVQARSASE